ncbi:UvrD-helicase domain-containing protein [Kribbella deserti]|uniref:DNA 3'-5' helicase n=1 Tax=Kribbella deserti TaxID=1926257 RepID=A0ABV6QNZ5_9ACTN
MTELKPPFADAVSRARISDDTATTLFVEAGAGSGKTHALVDRVTTLVLRDGVPLRSIAAVTFTEKAGAELRDRLRVEFEQAWYGGSDAAAEALDDLDSAAIATLHSFAQQLLLAHPIEAGLPPLIEVLDEVGSSVAFEERWAELQRQLLDDESIAEPLLLAMAVGVELKHVRSLAKLFGNDWDLIGDRVLVEPPELVAMPDLSGLVAACAAIGAQAADCRDADDRLLAKVLAVQETGRLLSTASDQESQLALLHSFRGLKFGRLGRKENWPDIAKLRSDCSTVVELAVSLVDLLLDACLRHLSHWVAVRVLESAELRRAAGRLEFHDLLVLARDLLRRDPAVRDALQERYQHLLLDEFQDTDPIQIELAVRIAAGAAATASDWRDVEVPPGRLFVVGDPKQSIYRFRRANIATYLDAQDSLGETVALTTNFRTVPPILDWLNEVFSQLIEPADGAQPSYQPLDPHRAAFSAAPSPVEREPLATVIQFPTAPRPGGPSVVVLGAEPHQDLPRAQASVLREREAADVAGVVRQALAEQWQVYDEQAGEWRPAGLGDIAVLVPARTSLPYLEEALDAAGISYRAEASSLVYQTAEVRDLLACARAIADPSDRLSLVTALRSPLFGCGDDDLFTWKRDGGSFTLTAPIPAELADHPVAEAMDWLRSAHYAARWQTPSEVLGKIVADRRMLEVATIGPRSRDAWRRLRFVVDQARAWSEVEHGGLRAYLAWAAHQGEEASRVAEAVLPETDADAVRVMTIHAAKGLEFPIVVLSGMTAAPNRQRGVQVLWPTEGGYAVKLKASVQTEDFDLVQPVDEQMDAYERRRLLYVAATRARDHLVVSLHRSGTRTHSSNAELFAGVGGATAAGAVQFNARAVQADVVPAALTKCTPPMPHDTWTNRVTAARTASRRKSAQSASGLEGTNAVGELDPATAKGARDLELPPWSKGRYGTAIGRAVHGVLQIVDLGTGAGLGEAVAAQCVAEGVTEHAEVVEALVRSALASDVVRRAAGREHWRESYVGAAQPDGTVLEGFVDLIYREDDGELVIVDYKTDAIPAAALEERVAYYAPQLKAYATIIDPAASQVLLFLNPTQAVARTL